MKKKNILNYPKYAAMEFFPRDSSRTSSNSHGKREISVRAIEVPLYSVYLYVIVSGNKHCLN